MIIWLPELITSSSNSNYRVCHALYKPTDVYCNIHQPHANVVSRVSFQTKAGSQATHVNSADSGTVSSIGIKLTMPGIESTHLSKSRLKARCRRLHSLVLVDPELTNLCVSY